MVRYPVADLRIGLHRAVSPLIHRFRARAPQRRRGPSVRTSARIAIDGSATVYESMAMSNADAASDRTDQEDQTRAIGEGLAAVAYGLLDVAHAIRELAEAQRKE